MLKPATKKAIGRDKAGSLQLTYHRARYMLNRVALVPVHRVLLNPINRARHARQSRRCLEIGPGAEVIPGFETINVVTGRNVSYVGDAARRLPFPDETFDVVYASHVIEHVPWYQVERAVGEWARVLKRGGILEIWTPHGLRIAKAFVEAEESGGFDFHSDGWWRFNEEHDPCKWASGRCFSYGDGSGKDHPNWHRSLFSPRYLTYLLESAGLENVSEMKESQVRGYNHGWINLGMSGKKPD